MKKYYIFDFHNFWWSDKILQIETKKKLNNWDLFEINWNYFLNLWEKINRETLYKYSKTIETKQIKIIEKNFFQDKTIKLVHWLVKQYFTTYKNVLKLFLPTFEINKILKYKTKKQKTIPNQKLIIFPDIRTAYNTTLSEDIYYSWNTIIQKIKLFWNIKTWKTQTLTCTHSLIFQDWLNLKEITIYHPHRWYYKNQQDPRYNTFEIVKFLKNLYNCDLNIINDLTIH